MTSFELSKMNNGTASLFNYFEMVLKGIIMVLNYTWMCSWLVKQLYEFINDRIAIFKPNLKINDPFWSTVGLRK